MKRSFGVVAAAMLMFAGGAAHAQAPRAAPPPPIRAFPISTLETLGAAIYKQDQEAWVATDLVVADHKTLENDAFRGWIVAPFHGADRVRFLEEAGGQLRATYEVTFTPGIKPTVQKAADPALSDEEAARYTAVHTARANLGPHCGESYNTVVLPDPERDGWIVWFLTPFLDKSAIPFGGHQRFSISKDGKTILGHDNLALSCLTMPLKEDGFLMVGHIVSATPIETHVFLSLTIKQPIAVAPTDSKEPWIVNGASIKPLSAYDEATLNALMSRRR